MLDLAAPRRGDALSALEQVALEVLQGVGVVLELVVDVADVVEHRGVRRELVGAAELDEGRVIVALLE